MPVHKNHPAKMPMKGMPKGPHKMPDGMPMKGMPPKGKPMKGGKKGK